MSEPPPLSEAEEADLTALADGRLEPERRAEVEARVAADARLADALERQRAGLTAITAAATSVSAPVALRSRVEAMQGEPARHRRRRMAPLRVPRSAGEWGREAAYTIVGGQALPWPDGTETTIEGAKLRSFTDGDRTVVTWRRGGHTCVLSGEDVPRDSLLEPAAWKGKDAVTF